MSTLDRSAPAPDMTTWGTEPQMTDVEALMWRAEVDPRLRSDGVILDLLDSTPDWDRLVAAHEWGTSRAPRLRQRVIEDTLHLGPPAWVTTELDLGYHLSRVCLPPGAGLSELLEFASVLHMSPFDTARPLWQAVLVEGLPDGKAAYLLKFHHAMADGQGAVQLFDLVHSRTAAPSLDKVAPPRSPADPTTSTALALRRSGSLLTAPARGVRVLARQAVASIAQPQSTLAYLQSLARVTASPGTPSPLLRQRGLKRRLRLLEVDLASLRAAGKAAGGTLNDAYLAGLLGGLGRYHAVHGTQVGDLPIALPVSLRHEAHSLGGNQFAGAYLAGPAGEPDPAVRIRKVHERVLAARAEPALDFLGVTAGLTSRLPSGVLAALSFKFASAIDLQASNIPGLDRAAFLAGSRIERMFVFGPVPGSAIMATLLSHEGTCCIGIAMDNDAVPDPDVLLACLRESFDEVLGA